MECLVLSDPAILERHRSVIIKLADKHRLPAVYPWRVYVEDGGLMTYAADLLEMHRRSATYVDKILKGAKPAEVPVEQPTKFELVIKSEDGQTDRPDDSTRRAGESGQSD
jgi:putative ABC transport system substrate-binding protein